MLCPRSFISANDAKWEAIARMTEMRDRGIAAFIGPGNQSFRLWIKSKNNLLKIKVFSGQSLDVGTFWQMTVVLMRLSQRQLGIFQ